MRFLGIDFGSKRVGIAISDASNVIAVPMKVVPNNRELLDDIDSLCRELDVGGIVMGESKDYHDNPNPIMKKIEKFKNELEDRTKLPVYYEPEFLSSAMAARSSNNVELLDAAAAAIILQSYLDKREGVSDN